MPTLTWLLAGVRRPGLSRAVGRELVGLAGSVAHLPEVLAYRGPVVTEVPFPRRVPAGSAPAGPPPVTVIDTPVVLVHGYLGSDAPWAPLAARLQAAGYTRLFTVRYDSLSAGVPELAGALVAAVDTVMARTGASHVHLVGHSLGGLVARYAVQRLGLDEVTRSVTTVATPHGGSPLARFGPGPAAAQLRPGSVLLRGLPPLDLSGPVRWRVIAASADLVVPVAPLGAVTLAGYGHHSILAAPELADAVLGNLRNAAVPTAAHALVA